jgi:hypothetical protein
VLISREDGRPLLRHELHGRNLLVETALKKMKPLSSMPAHQGGDAKRKDIVCVFGSSAELVSPHLVLALLPVVLAAQCVGVARLARDAELLADLV